MPIFQYQVISRLFICVLLPKHQQLSPCLQHVWFSVSLEGAKRPLHGSWAHSGNSFLLLLYCPTILLTSSAQSWGPFSLLCGPGGNVKGVVVTVVITGTALCWGDTGLGWVSSHSWCLRPPVDGTLLQKLSETERNLFKPLLGFEGLSATMYSTVLKSKSLRYLWLSSICYGNEAN